MTSRVGAYGWLRRLAKRASWAWDRDLDTHQRWGGIAALLTIVLTPLVVVSLVVGIVVGVRDLLTPQPTVTAQGPEPESEVDGPDTTTLPCADEVDSSAHFSSCLQGRSLADDEYVRSLEVGTVRPFVLQLYYQNLSSETQDDVVMRLRVSDDLHVLAGSSAMFNSSGERLIPDGIDKGGAIIGSYAPRGNAFARVVLTTSNPADYECGENAESAELTVTNAAGSSTVALPILVVREDC